MEECLTKPTPKDKKKTCKAKALITIKTWDDYQMKMKLNTRGVATSIHHQALLTCALCHEVTSTQALVG